MHRTAASRAGNVGPGLAGAASGPIDVLGSAQRHPSERFGGRGIDGIQVLTRAHGLPGPSDIVFDESVLP